MPPASPDFTSSAADPRAPSGLALEVVSTPDALRALRPEWDGLHAAAGDGNPFTQWPWVWHWWDCFGRSRPLRRYRLHVYALRDPDGRLRAAVPLVLTVWGYELLALRALRLYGFRENTTELSAPLIWPGWEERAAAATVAALQAHAARYDWCVLAGIPVGGALHRWLEGHVAAAGGSWGPLVSSHLLPLPETWEDLRSRLKRNVKENIRHSYNSLRRDGHRWEFERVAAPDDLPAALDEFFRLHAARSAMPRAPRHPDHYRAPAARTFLRAVAADLAPRGGFLICRLRVNGTVVASRVVLPSGGTVFLSYSGYHPAWRQYGVMTLLTTECLKMAIADGAHTVNLSTGTDPSKLRWGPEERLFQSVQLFAPTGRARLAAHLHRLGLAAKKRWWEQRR